MITNIDSVFVGLENWVNGQRLAFGAALLSALTRPRPELVGAVFEDALGPPGRPPEALAARNAYIERLLALPPAALELIQQMPATNLRYWAPHQAIWKEAFQRATWDGKRSPVAGAKLVANRIRNGRHTAGQIVRLARLELDRDWRILPGIENAIDDLSIKIARAEGSTCVINALRQFRVRVRPQRWALVENALLQEAFTWPLLVLPAGDRTFACALPLALDVRFDRERKSPLATALHVRSVEWERCLNTALTAARQLWLKQNGSFPPDMKSLVRTASAFADLAATSHIVAPFSSLLNAHFELTDQSLETLLALEIFGRFIGNPGLSTTSVTGRLYAPKPDGEGGDYFIHTTDDPAFKLAVELKTEFARRSFFYNKMIVPPDSVTAGSRAWLEVRTGRLLSDYAQHAFGQNARRHIYIRTPDLAARFKVASKEPEILWPGEIEEIESILKEIAKKKEFCLDLRNKRATSVAQALKHINDEMSKSPRRRSLAGNERQAHFAFVRAVPDEVNDRFWQVIWRILGADDRSFERFAYTVSADAPAQVLAEQLDQEARFNIWLRDRREKEGPSRLPVRPPDVLVIVGAQHLSKPTSFPTGPFGRLRLRPIIDRLRSAQKNGWLSVPSALNPLVHDYLGPLRILLLDEGPDEDGLSLASPPMLRPLNLEILSDPNLDKVVEALSVFRFGFTLSMAKQLLSELGIVKIDECETILRRLRVWTGDSYLLDFADAAGEYVLNRRLSVPADEVGAEIHFRAANAMAGFLDRTEGAGRFDFVAALEPTYVHEAQWHLSEADRLLAECARRNGPKTSAIRARGRYRDARERLNHAGEPFGWTQLRWAAMQSIQADNEVWHSLREHLGSRPSGSLMHPVELTWAAVFARKLEDRRGREKQPGDNNLASKRVSIGPTAADLASEKWNMLDAAERSCMQQDQNEQQALRFLVASTRACFILEADPSQRGLDAARPDFDLSFYSLPAAKEVIRAHWFSYFGDCLEDARGATNIYRNGFMNNRIAGVGRVPIVETLAKYFGACQLGGLGIDRALLQTALGFVGPATLNRLNEEQNKANHATWFLQRTRDRFLEGCSIIMSYARF